MRRQSGFTLIELLVVVAIISLLMSILAPSLNRATQITRSAICRSNLHHLHIAFYAYAGQYKGQPFPYICDNNQPGKFWMELLRPYYSELDKIRFCPLAITPTGWGSAFTAWGPYAGWMNNHTGSYAINGWMYNYGPNHSLGYGSIFLNGHARIPLWADSVWVDAWPRWDDTVKNTPPPDLLAGANDGGMGRICIARHDRSVNIAFLAGNAENVSLERLWLLKWNKMFTPTEIAVP